MSKLSRLATTITTHLTQTPGAADAFYLDGRLSSVQKFRDSDITLDRTDEGFFFALFASADFSREGNRNYVQKKRSLDRITEMIKDEGRGNIDSAINDMAENAVHVTGRLSLSEREIRHPYYSGFLVKDGEMAAVTMAGGLAYLFRDDTLYPLTQDDFEMEAINVNGDKVDNFDIYGAGKAGTIRYSNISQIQVDDCVILCTREVMETIGQKGMLELLDQAYDQEEAAELVADAMAKDAGDTPFQFLMTFVEDLIVSNKRNKMRDSVTGSHKALTNVPISETAMTDETTRFDPQAVSPYSAAAAGLVSAKKPETPQEDPVEDYSEPEVPTVEEEHEESWHKPQEDDELTTPDFTEEEVPVVTPGVLTEEEYSEELEEEVVTDPATRDDRLTAAQSLRRDLPEEESWDNEPETIQKRGNGGKILLTIAVLVLLGLIFLGVAYLLNQNREDEGTPTENTTEMVTEAPQTEATTIATEATTVPTTQPTTVETTTPTTSEGQIVTLEGANGGTYPSLYNVESGDTFYGIFNEVYAAYNTDNMSQATVNSLIQLFVDANPEEITGSMEGNNVMIYADTTINVPDPSDILEVR